MDRRSILAALAAVVLAGYWAATPANAGNEYQAPVGPAGQRTWGAAALGFGSITTMPTTINAIATGTVIPSMGIRTLSVVASASSASTLQLSAWADAATSYPLWVATASLPTTGWTPIYAPVNEPFAAFRADVVNTKGATYSVQIGYAVGQN